MFTSNLQFMRALEKNTSSAKRRTRLAKWGAFLKKAREDAGLDQPMAAARLTKAGYRISKNGVAQLDFGRLTNPDDAILNVLAKVFGKSLNEVLAAFLQDKYPSMSHGTSELIRKGGFDVYEIQSILQTLPRLEKLVLIVPNFLDNSDQTVFENTLHAIGERKIKFVFCVPKKETEPVVYESGAKPRIGSFVELRYKLKSKLPEEIVDRYLVGIPLEDKEQLIHAVHDYVLFFTDTEIIGYEYILSDDGKRPAVAISLPEPVLKIFIEATKNFGLAPQLRIDKSA